MLNLTMERDLAGSVDKEPIDFARELQVHDPGRDILDRAVLPPKRQVPCPSFTNIQAREDRFDGRFTFRTFQIVQQSRVFSEKFS